MSLPDLPDLLGPSCHRSVAVLNGKTPSRPTTMRGWPRLVAAKRRATFLGVVAAISLVGGCTWLYFVV